jgi:hypothetical protein
MAFAERFSQLARRRGLTVTYAWSLETLDSLPLFHMGLALIAENLWKGDVSELRPRIRLALEQISKVVLVPDLSLTDDFEYEQYFVGVVDQDSIDGPRAGGLSDLITNQLTHAKELSV